MLAPWMYYLAGLRRCGHKAPVVDACLFLTSTLGNSISGLVVEYIVAIDVTWVRFPADAL